MKAIDVGKTVATNAGKKLVEKAAKKLPPQMTKKVNEVITKYVGTSPINLNKLIHGLNVNNPTASNVIVIQDLVKRLNGSGLKVK